MPVRKNGKSLENTHPSHAGALYEMFEAGSEVVVSVV